MSLSGVRIRFTCDQFPVQAEGDVDGDKFYFRARWGEWAFGVPSNPADDPADVAFGNAEGFVSGSGYDDTQWLTLDAARQIMLEAAQQYRLWKARAVLSLP